MLNCQARQTTVHHFEIKNSTEKQQNYRVETDLNNVTGAENFKVKPKENFKYSLSITPIRTESPKPEKTLELKSYVRKVVRIDIFLENPLEDPIVFEVFINGEGLLGEPTFQVEPKRTEIYELIFSPLKTGHYTSTIGFLNEKVREFWYDLVLMCEDNPITHLDLIECEIGKNATQYITFENSTEQELQIDYRSSNPTNFRLSFKDCDSTI